MARRFTPNASHVKHHNGGAASLRTDRNKLRMERTFDKIRYASRKRMCQLTIIHFLILKSLQPCNLFTSASTLEELRRPKDVPQDVSNRITIAVHRALSSGQGTSWNHRKQPSSDTATSQRCFLSFSTTQQSNGQQPKRIEGHRPRGSTTGMLREQDSIGETILNVPQQHRRVNTNRMITQPRINRILAQQPPTSS